MQQGKMTILTDGELDNPEWIKNYPEIVIDSYRQLQAALDAKDAEIAKLQRSVDDNAACCTERERVQQQLDAVLPDAVWAMEHVQHDFMPGTAPWHRAAAFLTTDLVKDFLTRQEQKEMR